MTTHKYYSWHSDDTHPNSEIYIPSQIHSTKQNYRKHEKERRNSGNVSEEKELKGNKRYVITMWKDKVINLWKI